MPRDWEQQFAAWARPPASTEQERCDNAASAVRNAIQASQKLRARGVSIFTQGSYRNNTNVRKDSDVDIGVLSTATFFHEPLPQGWTQQSLGFGNATYTYDQFKNEVEEALVSYFGRTAVTRGNKAFDVHETSYHVEADVAAFFEHRRYQQDGSYHKGVALLTDREQKRVVNWPEQHYSNGVCKNKFTATRFKSVVRILKALSAEMASKGIRSGDIPGFLNECSVYNVPGDLFGKPSYLSEVRGVLGHLYNNTKADADCSKWLEVSELKWLFEPSQKWTSQHVNAFALAAWTYDGLGGTQ